MGPLTPDQIDFIHVAPLSVLVAAASGKVDLNQLALQELANRGYDRLGVWVGFKQARAQYLDAIDDSGAAAGQDESR